MHAGKGQCRCSSCRLQQLRVSAAHQGASRNSSAGPPLHPAESQCRTQNCTAPSCMWSLWRAACPVIHAICDRRSIFSSAAPPSSCHCPSPSCLPAQFRRTQSSVKQQDGRRRRQRPSANHTRSGERRRWRGAGDGGASAAASSHLPVASRPLQNHELRMEVDWGKQVHLQVSWRPAGESPAAARRAAHSRLAQGRRWQAPTSQTCELKP